MVSKEIKEKLLEAISYIENEAQNQQVYDTTPSNFSDWTTIEAEAHSLREIIEELEVNE